LIDPVIRPSTLSDPPEAHAVRCSYVSLNWQTPALLQVTALGGVNNEALAATPFEPPPFPFVALKAATRADITMFTLA
jgi:hypothetical protein